MKHLLLSMTIVAASAILSQSAAFAANTLGPGETLRNGEYRVSNNGKYELVLQHDNNLVLYRLGATPVAIWASGTQSTSGVVTLTMQTDGNLVMYVHLTAFSKPIWASNTNGRPGTLVLQDDGNLVIYASTGGVTWATNTNQ
jgi:hypothetical protein